MNDLVAKTICFLFGHDTQKLYSKAHVHDKQFCVLVKRYCRRCPHLAEEHNTWVDGPELERASNTT